MNDQQEKPQHSEVAAIHAEPMAALLAAVKFAADKHRYQKRKGAAALPYINHPVEVAELLARMGGVGDLGTLQAAILHDTIEDTETTAEELEEHFGPEVRHLVEEVTDDKSLPKVERKRLQVEHTPHRSTKAKHIKLADKICNVRDVGQDPPSHWALERRQKYLAWATDVVAGCRGCNPALEEAYDECLAQAQRAMVPVA